MIIRSSLCRCCSAIGALCVYISPISAAASETAPLPDDWYVATSEHYRASPVVTLSFSPAWTTNMGSAQTITLEPDLDKTYVPTNGTRTFFDAELFFGGQKAFNDRFAMQLGVVGAITNDFHISGIIWDDADPRFDNYTYHYSVQHAHLAVKTKVLGLGFYDVRPYVSGSIGMGLNSARDFESTPLIYEAVPTPNFNDRVHTTLVYTLGIGLQRHMGEHLHWGFGYEFESWGGTQLAPGPDQIGGQAAFVPHLYVSELMLSITYAW